MTRPTVRTDLDIRIALEKWAQDVADHLNKLESWSYWNHEKDAPPTPGQYFIRSRGRQVSS